MKIKSILGLLAVSSMMLNCGGEEKTKTEEHLDHGTSEKTAEADHHSGATKIVNKIHYKEEVHLKNIKQITFGGDNAEAYWSFDDTKLVSQITNPAWGIECDQIFIVDPNETYESKQAKMVSTGKGRTTCSYFMPGDSTILYASTHLGNDACPPKPEKRNDGKYVWPIYPDFDIFVADMEGNIVKQLTDGVGYDAEATVSAQGDKIVFTSTRTGDLELFTMDIDGSNVKQITFDLGYDGGAFFSPDGTKLIFRSSRPKTEEEIKEYKELLAEGLVKPTDMELYVCNVDGSNLRQITDLGGANWAPFYHPSGEKIIFSSNHATEKGIPFNLFMVNEDGTGEVEQITFDGVFDSFPMFSYDGKKLIFSSNRNNNGTHDTNLFVADWVD